MDNVDPPKKDLVRQKKGRKIALKNDLIQVSNNHFHIHSQSAIEIQGSNKWLTLIQNAKFSSSNDLQSEMRGGDSNG